MNRGDRRSASGQRRSHANAGSSSVPGRGGAGNNDSNSSSNANNSQSKREEDEANYVPGANIVRIMRRVLPSNAKISDDAKGAIQECVTEYISFITSEANERCQREHRKTVTPEDILYALSQLGFDDYVQPLTHYLNRYREFESERTSVEGEPNVFRTVTYQQVQAPQSPPPPPPPPMYFNPQVAPPQLGYFYNPAAMNGYQGYSAVVAPPGTIVDAGQSSTAGYAPGGGTGGCPYNGAYPPLPPGQFFQ